MPTLYVTEPGSRIEKEYERLLVTKEDEVLLAVPLTQVTEVVLTSGVGVTTPALLSLLDHGTGLSLISSAGRLRGRLIAAEARNLPLRHKQYARSGDVKFCLEISRAIVAGKLKNLRTMARRMLRSDLGSRKSDLESETADREPPTSDDGSQSPDPKRPASRERGELPKSKIQAQPASTRNPRSKGSTTRWRKLPRPRI